MLPVHWHTYATPLGQSVEETLAGPRAAAWCTGPGASALTASRRLMAWRDAHLGKETCQPHLLAGWGLLPVFLPRQAGRSPAASCGQYCLTQCRARDRG